MKVEKTQVKHRNLTITIASILVLSVLINTYFFPSMIQKVNADTGDIFIAWNNETSLNITVTHLEPRINWYDFQYNNSGTWESKLNQKIDVDNSSEYRFIINISSDQGWDDIEYVNITSWYDNGDENTSYNQTLGGNLNLYMQYDNTTGTYNVDFNWPDNEASYVGFNERIVTDITRLPGVTESRNMTFTFIPGYQFRYAPGPTGGWNTTKSGPTANSSWDNHNNKWSWNFNITVSDSGEGNAGQIRSSYASDEFGTYAYSEFISAGWPTIIGNPGGNYSVNDAGGSGNITLTTRSNGNYSLSINLSDPTHTETTLYSISNESIWIRGGNRTSFRNFSKGSESQPVYIYGGGQNGMPTAQLHEADDTYKTTSNVEYKCFIPFGQQAGTYESTIYYRLRTSN